MRSRIILNLALLVVVAILGALAFFEPFKKKPESIPIATVDENALTTLTLKNKDTITFEKKDGHWRLVAPFAAPANDTRVRQLIDIAKANSDARYPLKPEDRAKFGLDKPKASLVLGSTTLVFGDLIPSTCAATWRWAIRSISSTTTSSTISPRPPPTTWTKNSCRRTPR